MWEPLPLSSLDPAPAKTPSSPERRATFPEQELQQLEIGTGAAASGVPGSLGPARAWAPCSSQPAWFSPSSFPGDARPPLARKEP